MSEDKPGRNGLLRCLQVCGWFHPRQVCVSYQDSYLPASAALHSFQAHTGGRGRCSWMELASSFPAIGSHHLQAIVRG